jgi:hypothetical protein
MSKIDQLPDSTQTIRSEAADRFDEIVLLLKFGLDSSASFAGKKNSLGCKGDHAPPQKQQLINDTEIICLCGGNIFLNGCCSKHNTSKSLVSSLNSAAGSVEDPFVAMFRDYFGIPSTVEIA